MKIEKKWRFTKNRKTIQTPWGESVVVRQIERISDGKLGAWVQKAKNLRSDVFAEGGTIGGTATIKGGTIKGGTIWGGTIKGGTIWGGTIWGGTIGGTATIEGGTIWGGTIKGGTIKGGTIEGGTIEGGAIGGTATIKGGTIKGGTIWGGTIWGGTIEGGTIEGGTITISPLLIQGFRWPLVITEDPSFVFWGCETIKPSTDLDALAHKHNVNRAAWGEALALGIRLAELAGIRQEAKS